MSSQSLLLLRHRGWLPASMPGPDPLFQEALPSSPSTPYLPPDTHGAWFRVSLPSRSCLFPDRQLPWLSENPPPGPLLTCPRQTL